MVDWDASGAPLQHAMRCRNQDEAHPLEQSQPLHPRRHARAWDAGADEYIMKPFDGGIVAGKLDYLGRGALEVGSIGIHHRLH